MSQMTDDAETTSHEVDGVRPRSVVYPADVQDLSRLMGEAYEDGAAVAPWGGGTRTHLGNRPERLDRVVDLSRLDGVVEHSPGDLTATVQAGLSVARLQDNLKAHGQFLAIDPPVPDRATMGGVLAVGASGPLKWQYGSPRDVVIGMKVVAADGTVTKSGGQVVKNVSGYDMARLHVGGLGTLGIIAEVSVKLTPLPARQATVVAEYNDARRCVEAGLGVFRGDVVPLAITTFDAPAGEYMGAGSSSASHTFAVRLAGRPLTLERQIAECRTICRNHEASRIDVLDEDDGEALWRGLADFGWADEARTAPLGRATVLPSVVPDLVEELRRSGERGEGQPSVVSNPAHGTALLCWPTKMEEDSSDAAAGLLQEARRTVNRLGGKMVFERCPPGAKASFDVWDEVGESVDVMRRMKEVYDPKRVLNPGRFAGGI